MNTRTPDVITIGETMGLFFPPTDMPLASRPPFHLSFGGAETNVAIGLARLGHSVGWIGRLGDDEVGRFIDNALRAEAVCTPGLFGPGHTGIMVRTPRGFGRTAVQYSRSGSAGSGLSPDDIANSDIESTRVLHLTGITAALGDGPLNTILLAARTARASGVTVSLDLNYRSSLWSPVDAQPVLAELTSLAEVVFATADEADVLLGSDPADSNSARTDSATHDAHIASRIADLGPREVILKRGSAGALSFTSEGTYVQRLTAVVERDPVGAGDAFAAGYIHGILTNLDPQARLDFAGRVAAHSVTVVGDWEGLPRPSDLTDESRDILR
ncbi:MAG: sugar kinase [Leucobacter sp.]